MTILESAELPLLGVLGREMGAVFAGLHRERGVDLRLGAAIASIAADGVQLATFATEDRRTIPFDQIPQVMRDAQVAAEDRTFWTNPCVDFRGIVRAFVQNLTSGRQVSGASTICQHSASVGAIGFSSRMS